ncbi:hypothetical protein FRC12_019405 [Ceratobasidium sp. 428]|nr:hypothetical protein FRC12_019405 [Ceratobasidium sp. 428]
MTACPLTAPPSLDGKRAIATISTNDPYECVQPEEDLHNCGGCSLTGEGVDCDIIEGVRAVGCTEGKCIVYTCEKGYKLSTNERGIQECVPKPPRRM